VKVFELMQSPYSYTFVQKKAYPVSSFYVQASTSALVITSRKFNLHRMWYN